MHITTNDIANGRNALVRTAKNIEQAAAYCSTSYLNSKNQKVAIEETMNYATQSLGTMIHQLNQLASCFLKLLDDKSGDMACVEDNVNKLSVELKMRQEKVARKAIGSCTISKVPVKYNHTKLRHDPPPEYIRRPIDYSVLDHIGHGFKSQGGRSRKQSEPVNGPYGMPNVHAQTMTRRSSTTTHPIGISAGQVGTIDSKTLGSRTSGEYAASSVTGAAPGRFQSGTLGRTAGIYRTGFYGPQHVIAPSSQHSGPMTAHQMEINARSNSPSGFSAGAHSHQNIATGSLGHSRRTSSSSGGGLQGVHYQRNNYGQNVQVVDTSGQQRMIVNQVEDVGPGNNQIPTRQPKPSPTHQQMPPDQQQQQTFHRQQSEPVHSQNIPQSAPLAAGFVQSSLSHRLPTPQYSASEAVAFTTDRLPSDMNNINVSDLPPPPMVSAEETHPRPPPHLVSDADVTQAITTSAAAAVIDRLDSVVGMSMPLNTRQSAVDISRLQPSPMDHLRPRQPNDAPWAPNNYIQKVFTVYEYTADKNDELTFGENELIYVIKKNDDGWWEGVMNGNTGLFPGNYVEAIE